MGRIDDTGGPAQRLAVSDVHGHLGALCDVLEEYAIIDGSHRWVGASTRLWFLGDYVDRGRDGLGVIDLVRRLEQESRVSGGVVAPLLGNHELQFLAALHFGDRYPTAGGGMTWRDGWIRYGGIEEELNVVDEETVAWIASLPLIGLDDDDLLLHSDTDAYLDLGPTVEEINATGREILQGRDADAWAMLHRILTRRNGFRDGGSPDELLWRLGARRVVHGHSSLISSFGLPVERSGGAHVYASERAMAIDGGVFEGGSLVVARL